MSDRSGSRRAVVLAWMPFSQRTRTLAHRLGFDLILLGRTGYRRPWSAALAYPLLAIRTVIALLRHRPSHVVVVAPPVVAPLVVLPVARMLGARVAIDIHSGALLDRRWRWSVPLLRLAARSSDSAIVTLSSLTRFLKGARCLIIPDPLPCLQQRSLRPVDGDSVVAVCGWADDEPLDELVAAARDQAWHLTLTGRPRRSLIQPPNVSLSGHVADEEYVSLLSGAAVVVVLTTRDETLLSGAWEAITLARPVVVSDTPALRATFGEAVAYANNDQASIRAAIGRVLSDRHASRKAQLLKSHWKRHNDIALAELRDALRLDDSRTGEN